MNATNLEIAERAIARAKNGINHSPTLKARTSARNAITVMETALERMKATDPARSEAALGTLLHYARVTTARAAGASVDAVIAAVTVERDAQARDRAELGAIEGAPS